MRLTPLLFAFAALPVLAADPKPEIGRAAAAAQAVGAAHTLRTIPEACARIEGVFTGRAADPYEFSVVRTSPRCQARAVLADAVRIKPSPATGWILNDLVRVPSAACPSREAVVEVWRKPAANGGPELDTQGAVRVYLDDQTQRAASVGKRSAIAKFAVAMSVQGEPCDQPVGSR
ncbi:hypothetical protein [Lysobacter sp. D1-1-M9]|uniref:hypothetical protein n=1 Tax=Novilysobacter longmucuonensis TaxID=3098603 RepID=UPI002FCBD0E2